MCLCVRRAGGGSGGGEGDYYKAMRRGEGKERSVGMKNNEKRKGREKERMQESGKLKIMLIIIRRGEFTSQFAVT